MKTAIKRKIYRNLLSFVAVLVSGVVSFSNSLADFESLSDKGFSATAISGLNPSANCQAKKTGQVLLVTSVDVSGEAEKVVVALSNNATWTKRGKLHSIGEEIKEKLIEKLKEEGKTEGGNKKATAQNVVSGSYFFDVPIGQNFTAYLYSSAWKENGQNKAIVASSLAGPADACDSVIFRVSESAETKLQSEFAVCVHGQNPGQDSSTGGYGPKRTFIYGKEDKEIEEFKKQNPGSVVSLGPCQNAKEVIKNAKEEKALGALPSPSEVNKGDSTQNGAFDTSSERTRNRISIGSTIPPGTSGWKEAGLVGFNELRAEAGLGPLMIDEKLQKLAKIRMDYLESIGQCRDHLGSENPEFIRAIVASGIELGSIWEIMAWYAEPGVPAAQAVKFYKREGDPSFDTRAAENKDKAHYRAIINPKATAIGITSAVINGALCHLEILGYWQ